MSSCKKMQAGFAHLKVLAWSLATACLIAPATVGAQIDSPSPTVAPAAAIGVLDEVIVTARKRNETLVSVPVTVFAADGAELQRRGVINLDGIARLVPQLIIMAGAGGVQGGDIAIRGIQGPDSNPFGDQAVAFNLDGVAIANAAVRRMSDTDIEEVEVLKGPQALFYGKNSPGGVISIRSRDPTDRFEAGISTDYEFNAREIRTDGYVSGPVTDTLGVRLSGNYSGMEGWLKDLTPRSSIYAGNTRNPDTKDFSVRGTLKWKPEAPLDATLKLNYSQERTNGQAPTEEFVHCALGASQFDPARTCNPGPTNLNPGFGPFLGTIPATLHIYGDGRNFLDQKQFLGSLNVNYRPSDELTLTSVTGYYYSDLEDAQNYTTSTTIVLPAAVAYTNKEFSQELRLASDYKGPLNFVAGGYFSDTHANYGSSSYLFGGSGDLYGPGVAGPTTPLLLSDISIKQIGRAYSSFLQVIYRPIDVIEIDAGGRYSYEQKRLPLILSNSSTPIIDDSPITNSPTTNAHWSDFSPEATVAYRPSTDLTVYGSYKQGFLSGGFNSNATNFSLRPDLSYRPETIKGFEAGVKSRLLNGSLRLNFAAYTYTARDLQLTNYQNAISILRNAGIASIKGFETDFSYRTPIDGLSLHGAAAFNRARYTSYPGAPCYAGQTPAEGCSFDVFANPVQNLTGATVPRAPKLNLSGGLDFETPVGSRLKLGVSGDVKYSTSYLTDSLNSPEGQMPSFALVDASVRVGDVNDKWEFALIGRNLTNRYIWVNSVDVPFTGSGTGTAAGIRADTMAVVDRGREIMLKASYKYH